MASDVIYLATSRKFNFSKVGKGFFGVETPLFASMLVQPQPQAAEEEDDVDVPAAPWKRISNKQRKSKQNRIKSNTKWKAWKSQ
nr:hypothetical protein [Tanacetum cinerariifolium]